jgi:magnesium-transporting ATPase (P-type)
MIIDSNTIIYEGNKQLLYRGARLKNTKWIYGLVIYTGKNTKIMMNSESSSEKMSQVERKVNHVLGIILMLQIVMCFFASLLSGIFTNKYSQSLTNINSEGYSIPIDSILIFFTYLVLLNTMIPISLIVSI